jgi:gamma-polyglutamate biosynthesis protein CapC
LSDAQTLYIGIGLIVSLLFSEIFGVAPGGIIVPGYLALGLRDPVAVVLTLAVALLTFFVVRVLATVTIIYGRRRTVLSLLLGFLIGSLVRQGFGVPGFGSPGLTAPSSPYEVEVIGYIIPGLIAIWMDRQGTVVTVSMALTASVVTRLTGILLLGV